ncbi:MAG: Ribonuclease HII [Methanonatronarchaeales archaeon]|nr:Ribonuclease HII [Methanonatronarchaeales archaeon]
MLLAGADEAGKGPVIGPLVVAAVSMEHASVRDTYRDSKEVRKGERRTLAEEIVEKASTAVAVKGPGEIDDRGIDTVLREGYVETLSALDFDEAYADAADVRPERFGRFLSGRIGRAVVAEHRADENHRIVGAASILAKVERDRRVAELAEGYGEIGSGYPSDPRTVSFLEGYVDENGRLPDCSRRSWATSKRLLARKQQSGLSDL